MTSPPALAKHSASSVTESPPQALSIREMRRRKPHVRRSPNSPCFTENGLKMHHFHHRRTLSHHQNERHKTPAVISGDFDGALASNPKARNFTDFRMRFLRVHINASLLLVSALTSLEVKQIWCHLSSNNYPIECNILFIITMLVFLVRCIMVVHYHAI